MLGHRAYGCRPGWYHAIGGKVDALSTDVDQKLFRQMRQIADVVLVGAETVRRRRLRACAVIGLRQGPTTSPRKTDPPIAVVTGSLVIGLVKKTIHPRSEYAPTTVITAASVDPERLAEAKRHAPVIIAGQQRVEPAAALQALADRGLKSCYAKEALPCWANL